MSRVNITTGRLYLALRAQFGQNFIDEAARVSGAPKAHVKRWLGGKSRVPANLLIEMQKLDPEEAYGRIDRYFSAATARLERDRADRKRRVGLARDFIAEALAKAPDAPQALRQRKRGEAPEAPQKRTK